MRPKRLNVLRKDQDSTGQECSTSDPLNRAAFKLFEAMQVPELVSDDKVNQIETGCWLGIRQQGLLLASTFFFI
eukprot:763356-Hanusia_phi.AAC.3